MKPLRHGCPVALCGAFAEFSESKPKNNCLKGLKWSPDGTCILSASEDQLLRVFELPTDLGEAGPTELRSAVCAREGDAIYDYDWFPAMDSSDPVSCCFVSACRDHPLHLWDAYSGALRASYMPFNHLDEICSAYAAAFDLGGAQLYCGFERAIRVFDVSRPGRQCELRRTCATKKSRAGQRGIISSFAFAPDYSGLFAAGSYSGCTVSPPLLRCRTARQTPPASARRGCTWRTPRTPSACWAGIQAASHSSRSRMMGCTSSL